MRLQGEWAFSIPDAFGRTTLSGVCSSAPDPASLATETVRAVPAYEEAGMLAGYRVEGVTLSSPHHVTAYYYDDYGFLVLPEFSGKGLEYTVSEVDGCFLTRYGSDAEAYKHTGLLTGGRTAIFSADPDMDSCLYAATYYDDRKRPVQIRCSGYHGLDHEYLAYTFTGQRSISRHVYPGDWTVTSVNGYDHAERLRMTTVGVNGPSGSHADTRIRYDYDELGRLSSRTYETGDSPLRTDYTHNIRGWLTGQQDDGFRMALAYESPQYVAPSYTGNIAEWTWRHAGGEENTYAFAYDGLSRLTDTRQYQAGERTDRFVERSLTYDRNGNILTLQRSQGDAVTTDFAYTYAGNRLVSLSDSGTAYPYAYDTNGNLVHDGVNGLDMTYNRLNLIEKVTRDGRLLANFSYLSNGRKYLMSSDDGHGLCYVGSLVYERPSSGQSLELESVEFDGGRFIKTSGGLEARYFVTDHLGSVRAVRTSSGEVVEQNDYYPFGLRWADSGSSVSDNRYRYNGKEDLSFLKIPYTDFGFRQFDPKFRLGWNGADPLAEKYFPVSPYAFCAGNPVKYMDRDGKKIYFSPGVSEEFKTKFAQTVQYMNEKGTAGNLAKLNQSEKIYYINEVESIESASFNPKNQTINWDPNHLIQTDEQILMSPATVLAHEMDHAQKYDEIIRSNDSDAIVSYNNSVKLGSDKQYHKKEERRVIEGTEQIAAKKHGEIRNDQKTRTNHKGKQRNENISNMSPEEISRYIYEFHNQYMK